MAEYPKDWNCCRLTDAVEINPSASGNLPSEFKYIDLESVKKGRLIRTCIYKKGDAPSRAQRRFKKGDVLFQTVRPYQCNNLFVDFEPEKFVASTGYAVLHEKEGISSCGYIYHYVLRNVFVEDVLNRCTGTSYPAINPKHLGAINVVLPPLPEQKRIAKVLGDVDKLIENLGQRIEKKKLIKKGAMQELLTGEKRLPGFSGEWEACKLGDIIKYSVESIPTAMVDKRWYVGTENMKQECKGIVPNTAKIPYVSVRAYSKGDVLLSNIRPYLKKCWLADRAGGCSSDVLVLRGVDVKVSPSFLYMIVSNDAFFEYSMENVVGTKMPRGDKKAILRYSVKVPKKDEQEAIAEVLADMDAEIDNLEKQRAKLKLVKKGMLQDLLTGKVRLKG